MESRNLGKIMGVLLAAPVALFVAGWVLTNPTGAISGLSKLVTFAIAFVALTNPRMGLFLLVPQVIYTDEIKRIAVSYGSLSYTTIYEVLLGPIITVACLNAGFFAAIAFGRAQISKGWIMFYGLIAVISGLLFATAEGSVPTRAQLVLNTGLYMTVIPLMAAYFDDAQKVRKFLLSQVWWALPSALWGIQQYYFGLNKLELDYARTGLSATHYGQVFGTLDPRPFGFFGSNSGYSSVGIFGILSFLYLTTRNQAKFWNLLLFAFYAWAIYASKQRTILLIVPLVFATAWFFRSRFFTKVFYAGGILMFVLAVAFSDQLLNTGLAKINESISSNTKWGREVLSVSTFSDRLRGWTRLKQASTYSVFGTKEASFTLRGKADFTAKNYNHDVINKVLIETGVVGLLALSGVILFCLIRMHGLVFKIRDKEQRREVSVLLATTFMIVGLSFVAGSILSTNPINLLIWSIAGAFIILGKAYTEESLPGREKVPLDVRQGSFPPLRPPHSTLPALPNG